MRWKSNDSRNRGLEQLESGRGLSISVGVAGFLEKWDATMGDGEWTDMYPEPAEGQVTRHMMAANRLPRAAGPEACLGCNETGMVITGERAVWRTGQACTC